MKSNNFFVLLTLTLISLGIAVSCKSDKNPKRNPDKALSQLQWLIGSWEGSTKYGTARESWQKMNDSVLIGEGSMVNPDGSTSSEKLSIELQKGALFYIPIMMKDSVLMATNFVMSSNTPDMWIFENSSNKFPTKIKYIKKSNDNFIAELVGKNDEGKLDSFTFDFKRK
jgi:hypothetical protein